MDLQRIYCDKKVTPEMLRMINENNKENDKATARHLRAILILKCPDLKVAILTI